MGHGRRSRAAVRGSALPRKADQPLLQSIVSSVPGADLGHQSQRAPDRILTAAPDLFCELGELFFEPRGLRDQRLRWLPPIGGVQLSQITGDAFCSSYARRRSTFAPREVPIAIVPRLELAAVDRNARTPPADPSPGRVRQSARALRMARPLSFRKSATVLWSGTSRPKSHISSTLRPASRSNRRLDCTRLREPQI